MRAKFGTFRETRLCPAPRLSAGLQVRAKQRRQLLLVRVHRQHKTRHATGLRCTVGPMYIYLSVNIGSHFGSPMVTDSPNFLRRFHPNVQRFWILLSVCVLVDDVDRYRP